MKLVSKINIETFALILTLGLSLALSYFTALLGGKPGSGKHAIGGRMVDIVRVKKVKISIINIDLSSITPISNISLRF